MSAGKRVIQSLVGRLGYEVRRIPSEDEVRLPPPITVALATLLSVHDEVGIVQIGANDGRINDPIFPFLTNHINRTRALLIEPQVTVLPYLRSNYAKHPGVIIANSAIGPVGELTLYSIAQEAWEHCVVPYADPTWPTYRAPTGITSTNREMVVDWSHKYYRGKLPVSSVVVACSVESLTLPQVIRATEYSTPIHLLQVDVEGFDDEAIYNSDVDKYRPELVNFESKSLPQNRHARLVRYLEDLGYVLFPTGADTLGVLQEGASRRPPTPQTETPANVKS